MNVAQGNKEIAFRAVMTFITAAEAVLLVTFEEGYVVRLT